MERKAFSELLQLYCSDYCVKVISCDGSLVDVGYGNVYTDPKLKLVIINPNLSAD